MYIALFLVFATGFAALYAVLGIFGISGISVLLILYLVFLSQWLISPWLINHTSKLRYIAQDEYSKLQETVKKLSADALIPTPRLAMSPAKDPNVFVFGRTRKEATIVMHESLLTLLNENEMRAVLAHEMCHIKHNDFAIMTFISFLPMLIFVFLQNSFLKGPSSADKDQTRSISIAERPAYTVSVASEVLMLHFSRVRERFADAYSAQSTSTPAHLASALTKITYGLGFFQPSSGTNISRSFYIADHLNAKRDVEELEMHENELKGIFPDLKMADLKTELIKNGKGGSGLLSSLFRTHPSTYERLMLLSGQRGEYEIQPQAV